VRARTTAVVEAGGVLRTVDSRPPLTLRRVRSDDPATCALCLVGSAAAPLPGDDLELALHLEPGATATLSATGAAIAQGRDGPPARLALTADLATGAALQADPGPLVVCAGARVDVGVHLTLAADATVHWRELVVLGRTTDPAAGAVTIRWDVTRAGRPLLRQFLDLTDPAVRDWPGATGGHRVIATALLSGPDHHARTVVRSATAVAQRIDATSTLVTVLGDSAAEVTARLDELTGAGAHQAARA
jgi:urease accessory protein